MEKGYFCFGTGERAFIIIPGLSVRSVMLSVPEVAAVEIAEKFHGALIMYSDYGHAIYDEAPDNKSHRLEFFLNDRGSVNTKPLTNMSV